MDVGEAKLKAMMMVADQDGNGQLSKEGNIPPSFLANVAVF
jgi:hypothetical protein